ncbi:MAG TPA: ABC transporter substrate-binding protein [Ktedonobacterales bacterium]
MVPGTVGVRRTSLHITLPALGLLALVVPLAGCGAGSSSSGSLTPLTIGLTYVPNIQFAPFYVARELGYYKDAGLDVTLHHHTASEDEFGALVAGQENAIFAGGDEGLQARAQGPQLVYITQVYTKYPIALIVPADSPIHSAADLRGHSIGVPGKYGETYIGLLALLKGAGLSQSDVNIQSIGFTQVQALMGHKVDAVMGYFNNEPILFQQQGFAVHTLEVTSGQPLVSDGILAMQSELQAHPDTIKALVAATLRGLNYTLAHPQDAVNLSKTYVPTLDDPTQAASALTVLNATLPLWQQTGPKSGYTDPAAWQSMASFLQAQGQLGGTVDAAQSVSNAYLP